MNDNTTPEYSQALLNHYYNQLLDDPTTKIRYYPPLLVAFGANEGVILSVLHDLNEREEWVANSYEDWQERYFTWLSQRSIAIIFRKLEKLGVIESKRPDGNNKKKYYRINKAAVEKAVIESEEK